MDDAPVTVLTPHEGYLKAVAGAARLIEWPFPHLRDEADCLEMAHAVDALFVRLARSCGAIDVAIGDRLDALATRNGIARLGFASTGDYARELLGREASTAEKMARLARALRARPHLRAAVWAGEVSTRKAEAVLPLARGAKEKEWAARAKSGTVRGLKAEVRRAGLPDGEDEEVTLFCAQVPAQYRPAVDGVRKLKERPFTATTPRWQRIEAVCQERLGEPGAPDDADADRLGLSPLDAGMLKPLEQWIEETSAQWASLDQVETVAAPGGLVDPDADARSLDEELRRLCSMRDSWDDDFGHVAMVFIWMKAWRFLGFASLEQYCKERLGMSARAVRQRASLERRLHQEPLLREAIQKRWLSYEKARLIGRYALDGASVKEWVQRARRMTCIDLQRELQGKEDRKMCARGSFRAWLPRRVQMLFELACRAERTTAGRWLSPGECFGRMCERFLQTWKLEPRPKTVQKKVLARDGGFCRVPGCSRGAEHAHHIDYRAHGGGNELTNLTSVCAGHHLNGIHMGSVRVWGEAPDRLRWQLGVRPGLPPLLEYVSSADGPAILVDQAIPYVEVESSSIGAVTFADGPLATGAQA